METVDKVENFTELVGCEHARIERPFYKELNNVFKITGDYWLVYEQQKMKILCQICFEKASVVRKYVLQ